jgi:hypothetical protein
MGFYGKSGTYYRLLTGRRSQDAVADIYIRIGDGTPIPLRTVSESVLVEAGWRARRGVVPEDGTTYANFGHGGATIEFENDTLMYCEIQGTEDYPSPIAVGPSADGEFSTLPMTQRELVRIFGKPIRYGRSTILAP